MGHRQDPAQAETHRLQPQPVQPEGREQCRQHRPGDHHQPHDRNRQQVRRQPVMGQRVEMRRRHRCGRHPRHQGRDRHPRHRRQPARAEADPPVVQQPEHGDQCGGRGKGHLEPRPGQALGTQDQDDQRGQGHRPQRQRPAVGDHRAQHHRRHREGALGGDIAAGERQIARRGGDGGPGRDLARRQPQRQRRNRGQRKPERGKDEPGQQAHMQTRNRQQMRQVAGPQRLQRGLPDAAAIAGGDRGGKPADRSGQGRPDPCRGRHP